MMEEGEQVNLTTFGKKRKDQAKRKGKIPIQSGIKKESKCFFVKRRDTCRRTARNLRSSLIRKILNFPLYVMNLIWLMLIITHGGLILVLQSMFQIPYRVCKT